MKEQLKVTIRVLDTTSKPSKWILAELIGDSLIRHFDEQSEYAWWELDGAIIRGTIVEVHVMF